MDKRAELDRIAEEIKNCKECKKGKIGIAVVGEGNSDADIVFIGEAPGRQESITGRPFIGRAGKVLRKLINDIGLKEDDVYITSPVKYLPEYKTPTLVDIEHGRIHLNAQLKIINPKVVVLLGNTACLALLKEKFSISKEHGKIIEKDGTKYMFSYHPAAVLYMPGLKNEIEKDFLNLKELLRKDKI
ncbi:MAG TPA: uracil-DNA glycosylase [Candidatus Nanoarchaeia archaeon]|nr:uracil-DNA glycosylase [Candidatus Nanoarchaeia archaeon]